MTKKRDKQKVPSGKTSIRWRLFCKNSLALCHLPAQEVGLLFFVHNKIKTYENVFQKKISHGFWTLTHRADICLGMELHWYYCSRTFFIFLQRSDYFLNFYCHLCPCGRQILNLLGFETRASGTSGTFDWVFWRWCCNVRFHRMMKWLLLSMLIIKIFFNYCSENI